MGDATPSRQQPADYRRPTSHMHVVPHFLPRRLFHIFSPGGRTAASSKVFTFKTAVD